jgi:hypothetical protein
MEIQQQINAYIASLPEPKRLEMQEMHQLILAIMPTTKLWYFDGKNSENKTISNPNIGYGQQIIKYANNKTKPFYKIGLSANTTGISVYILGITDKTYLSKTFANQIGKASITGYCIKFKTLKDINLQTLKEAIQFGLIPQKE